MNFFKTFHGQQVIDARVEPHFINDGHAGIDGPLVQLLHGRWEIAGRHHVGLGGDALLGDERMKGVGQKWNDHVGFANQLLQQIGSILNV